MMCTKVQRRHANRRLCLPSKRHLCAMLSRASTDIVLQPQPTRCCENPTRNRPARRPASHIQQSIERIQFRRPSPPTPFANCGNARRVSGQSTQKGTRGKITARSLFSLGRQRPWNAHFGKSDFIFSLGHHAGRQTSRSLWARTVVARPSGGLISAVQRPRSSRAGAGTGHHVPLVSAAYADPNSCDRSKYNAFKRPSNSVIVVTDKGDVFGIFLLDSRRQTRPFRTTACSSSRSSRMGGALFPRGGAEG